MNEILRKLGWLFGRRRKEEELNEELQFHLNEEAEERRAAGLPEQDARWAARRELGNIGLVREDVRAAWGWTMLEQLGQDVRYACRTMSANKLFCGLAVASLALGIGANTAIYSFMDALLLRSLPVEQPGSLVLLNWHAKQFHWDSFVMHGIKGSTYDDPSGTTAGIFPFPAYELFRKNDSAFTALFAYHQAPDLNVAVRGKAFLAPAEYVSGDYFRGLGVPPEAGRLIVADDDRAGASPVAVLSLAFSRQCFGDAVSAVGQTVLINNQPFLVAGVAPPGFFGVDPAVAPDVFLPLHADLVVESVSQFGARPDNYLDQNYYWIDVMGRLRPGISLEQAQAAMAPAFANWVASTAGTAAERANLPSLIVKPGGAGLETLRRRYSRPLYVLMALVGVILAIACANVANLLLARSAARAREMALRLSLGAGQSRVIRQLLTESVLLSSLGGVLGILVDIGSIRFLTLLLANGDKNFTLHAQVNWHVLAIAAALSLGTGLLFGLTPSMRSARVDVISAMKAVGADQSTSRRPWRRIGLSHVLIVGQMALSLLLLIAAGLFVRTLSNLQSIGLGFNRENILLFSLDAQQAGLPSAEIAGFYGGLLQKLKSVPGVREASLSNQPLILAGFGLNHSIPGKTPSRDDRMLVIGPSFFKTMQIPILAGREIDERDAPGSPLVAVINERFARVNFGDENPIGRHVILSARREIGKRPTGEVRPKARDMEIVGIVRDSRYDGLKRNIPPVLYLPYNQGFPQPEQMVFEVRTAGDPLKYVNTVREIVRRADSRVPISRVSTQAALIDHTINEEIVFARLCTAFAILALVIAGVGLYGTVSYSVARRTGEIGIRMALGAQRPLVIRMILSQVLRLTLAGLVLGLPAALAASKLIASFLFDMKPNDPLALGSAVVLLLAAAILAGYAPARRASRIDPMAALRHQ
jgi:predicted permease